MIQFLYIMYIVHIEKILTVPATGRTVYLVIYTVNDIQKIFLPVNSQENFFLKI